MVKGKTSIGRQKIEIKRIESEEARQVCFSKRRQGLFNKATELSALCGVMVGVVVFSISGRPFSWGHPSIEDVINRFFNSGTPAGPSASGGVSHENGGRAGAHPTQEVNEYSQMIKSLEIEKNKKVTLEEEFDKVMGGRVMQLLQANTFELGQEDLKELENMLEQVRAAVQQKIHEMLFTPRQTPGSSSLPQPPVEMASTSQYQFGQQSAAHPTAVVTIPGSSNGVMDGSETNNDPLFSGYHGSGWDFLGNQNHG